MWSSFGVLPLLRTYHTTTNNSSIVHSISIYSRNWNGGPKEEDTFIIHPLLWSNEDQPAKTSIIISNNMMIHDATLGNRMQLLSLCSFALFYVASVSTIVPFFV
jgi:hypothetical protein